MQRIRRTAYEPAFRFHEGVLADLRLRTRHGAAVDVRQALVLDRLVVDNGSDFRPVFHGQVFLLEPDVVHATYGGRRGLKHGRAVKSNKKINLLVW